MIFSQKRERFLRILTITGFVSAIIMGLSLGNALAATHNIMKQGDFNEVKEALPSTLLDANGKIITQFFSDEKRDLITFNDVPRHLIDALTTREDQEFWVHSGFSMRGTMRALFQIMTFQLFSGGSTLTQQLAGRVFADRKEMSLSRKAVELWWAFMMEKKLSKQEILERYLNKMPFGQGTYGVEAASQFYFRHSVRDMTPAESAILAIQLVKPGKYNPFKNPNEARRIQEEVLKQMVESGYLKKDVAEKSLTQYWDNYDYTRSNSDTVFYAREDKAPYFSEYIRTELENRLLGAVDIYRDGYIIQTTLNLDYQALADSLVAKGRDDVEAKYQWDKANATSADTEMLGVMTMLGYSFSITDFFYGGRKSTRESRQYVTTKLTTTMDVVAKMFGIDGLQDAAFESYKREMDISNRNQVEGALVSIDNKTGAIRAMVGGTKFDRANQLNRAMQAQVQPGSSIKPLFYAAGIESGKFTAASLLIDKPTTFINEDGTEYSPSNYGGKWRGNILLRSALNLSLNIPSLKVMEGIGFDLAIDKMSKLLGITDPAEIARKFPRVYPLALGVTSVSPAQMARAFAIFANGGKEVVPNGIVEVKDRNGKVIATPMADIQAELKKKGADAQILTPQAAYVMVDILKSTLTNGTLYYAVNKVGGKMPMEMAGKTGTPQNWSDAWAIGFSPYMTTAVWYGFDKPGNSLGQANDGSTSAGPVWAEFMKRTHQSLPVIPFEKPSGIVHGWVNMEDGKIPSGHAGAKTRGEIFIAGTYPGEVSTIMEHRDSMMDNVSGNLDTTTLPFVGDGGFELQKEDLFNDAPDTPTPDIVNPILD